MKPKLFHLIPLCAAAPALAQGGPGGGPLPPPPVPPGNPITVDKANLGWALFWDEQLSSTRTVACGTCHIPEGGGSDPRSFLPTSVNPAFDGVFGTDDDVLGSLGVPLSAADGSYSPATGFGLLPQVTGRRSMSVINSAYPDDLFWDGRAEETFRDPITNAVVLPGNAALESQAVGPPVSDVEMAHAARDWSEIVERLVLSEPLALASDVPVALSGWIADRSYPQIFEAAFGSPDVTASRIAMAIATYERTLISDETPFNAFLGGIGNALTQQEFQGRQIFIQSACITCHGGPRLTDDDFHYTGVRPRIEDLGRFEVTGNNPDRGRMRTPTLLNVELRAPYFHNGGMATLEDVVDFYNRGGDFDAPNKAPQIQPLGLNANQRAALVAFLKRPLTDPRVRDELPPFDRPRLFTESVNEPQVFGVGTAGSGGLVPEMVALEPAAVGNPNVTIGVQGALGGVPAVLALDPVPDLLGTVLFGATFHVGLSPGLMRPLVQLQGAGAGGGWGSYSFPVRDDPTLAGTSLYAQWFVFDPGSPERFSATAAAALPHF